MTQKSWGWFRGVADACGFAREGNDRAGRVGSYYFVSQNYDTLVEVARFLREELGVKFEVRDMTLPPARLKAARHRSLSWWTYRPSYYLSVYGAENVVMFGDLCKQHRVKMTFVPRKEAEVREITPETEASREIKRKKVLEVLDKASRPISLGRIARRGGMPTSGLNSLLEGMGRRGEIEVIVDEEGVTKYWSSN